MAQTPEEAQNPADEDEGPLTISPEKVCFIVIKAREFDAKDAVTEPDPASNPSDDRDAAVLEDHRDDPVVEELTGLINALSEDEQIDLVALAWLGRDDIPRPTGRKSARRRRAPTTGAQPNTCLECLCLAISWRRASRCSAIPARNSKSSGCDWMAAEKT